MASLKRYKVILCPNCGHIQASSSSSTFKCFRCGKSRKIESKTHIGFDVKILDSFDHPRQAALYVSEYNKRKAQRKD